VNFDLDFDLEHTVDARLPGDHRVKFGRDPAICVREETICAKVYRRTDDGRLAIVLAHSWNELKTLIGLYLSTEIERFTTLHSTWQSVPLWLPRLRPWS